MPARREVDDAPEEFLRAVASLRAGVARSEVVLEESPAPQRIAPYAVALSADVVVGEEELGNGRLVLLHDPDRPDAWAGSFRLVTFVRAALDPEMAVDPLLPAVGWTWLLEALAARGARYLAPSGTVTRVASESFGSLSQRPAEAEIEVRASWTPVDHDMTEHLAAWCELLCTTAGLPPLPPGVTALPTRRARRRT